MMGLIVLFLACILVYKETIRLRISAIAPIVLTIALGILPGLIAFMIADMMQMHSMGMATKILGTIFLYALIFIPYFSLKGREAPSKFESDEVIDDVLL